jgi:propane monooxygenase reductase subunit
VIGSATNKKLPRFDAGQHVQISFSLEGEEYSQTLSIASGPEKSNWEFIVAKPETKGPATAFLALSKGDTIRVSKPAGTFTLDRIQHPHVALVGGGAGLAPLRSMILSFTAKGCGFSPKSVVLWHGARCIEELAFQREFENLQSHSLFDFYYQPCVSKQGLVSGRKIIANRVDEAFAKSLGLGDHSAPESSFWADLHPSAKTSIVVCGPPGMVDAVIESATGSPYEKDLIYEKWW